MYLRTPHGLGTKSLPCGSPSNFALYFMVIYMVVAFAIGSLLTTTAEISREGTVHCLRTANGNCEIIGLMYQSKGTLQRLSAKLVSGSCRDWLVQPTGN